MRAVENWSSLEQLPGRGLDLDLETIVCSCIKTVDRGEDEQEWVYAKPLPFPIRANKPLPYIGNAWAYWKKP
jgi:hypothetical protein